MSTWTRADSAALDVWARSHPNRTPLQRDPDLWNLFAPLRDKPRRTRYAGPPKIEPCTTCGEPMRRCKQPHPDNPAARRHGGRGMCMPCYMQVFNRQKVSA